MSAMSPMSPPDDRPSAFDARALVRKLGRPNARPLADDEARDLFAAMLAGRLDPVQLGAAWMGMRIKGESPAELAAFVGAAEAAYEHWPIEAAAALPVVIPSYNGARQLPNLTPLLACLLSRHGIRVIVHGVTRDPTRVTSAEVFAAMGIAACASPDEMAARQRAGLPAFIPIDAIAPNLARLLDQRWKIGARGSIHTVVKMLNPLTVPTLRLVSVTHPDYLERMRTCFASDPDGVLLLRGAEGEAVAHPRRALRMEWIGARADPSTLTTTDATEDVDLPLGWDADTTAAWIDSALARQVRIPPAIVAQVDACVRIAAQAAPASQGNNDGLVGVAGRSTSAAAV